MAGYRLEDIVACPSLPTLPTIAVQLLELTRDPDAELADIARLVESDPGLAARILKIVNSSLYGLRVPCTSIQRALTYLGLNAVKSLVLGFSLVEMTSELEDGPFDFRVFWKHSIFGAVASRHIASLAEQCDPDEAFTCGMFQNMGMLAAYVTFGDQYTKLLRSVDYDFGLLPQMEQERLGFTHFHAGAALSERWRFPSAMVECLRSLPDPDSAERSVREMTRIVALGRIVAEILSGKDPGERLYRLKELASDWLGDEFVNVTDLLASISEGSVELAEVLEKEIGERPDVESIKQQAEELSVELQTAIQREIEELRRQRIELTSAAYTDGLTGIWNRKRFDEELLSTFETARETRQPFAVLFVDADLFKSLNDRFGHQIGDAVLIELAQRLHVTVGSLGTVYRYGGEEFTVLIPNWDLNRAASFASLVRSVIESPQFDVSSVDSALARLPVTVSIGVSAYEPAGDVDTANPDPWDVVRAADEALYDAKNAGRNRVCTRNPEFGEAGTEDLEDARPRRLPPVAPLVPVDVTRSKAGCPTGVADVDKTRVLYVESDALAAALMRAVFSRHRSIDLCRTMGRNDTKQKLTAREWANERQPDVILCADHLADGDALSVLKDLQRALGNADVPFIVLLQGDATENAERYLKKGAKAVYSKEFMAERMSEWLINFLDQWGREIETKSSDANNDKKAA